MDIEKEIHRLIDIAIQEDIGNGDITAEACIPEEAQTRGQLTTKQSGTIAGLPYLPRIFQQLDPRIKVESLVAEGSYQKAGTAIATIEGPVRGILGAERTALNFIQHASGVASATAAYVRKVVGYDCEILDTRANYPGLRALEKYAIRVGGGTIHRYGLNDLFIIKRNYLAFLASKSDRPIFDAVSAARACRPGIAVEVEVCNLEELDAAVLTDVDAIILHNFAPEQARRCVKKIHATRKKAYIQSVSGISLETIREYAETGVDGISVHTLTHFAGALHISMRLISHEEPRLHARGRTTTFSSR